MTFQHPVNGYQKRIESPGGMTLLAGPLFFASQGIWPHAIISAILAVLTYGISWLVYPIFADQIIRNAYLSRGWTEVAERERPPQPPMLSAKTKREMLIVAAVIGAIMLVLIGIDAYMHPDAYARFYGLQ